MTDNSKKYAIILAAGKGTRMKSEQSKVMHQIIDRPMLSYVVEAAREAGAERILVITGYQHEQIENAFPQLEFALQEPQLGTGHAVMQAKALAEEKGQTLVINGDGPCIQPETLRKLYDENTDASLTLLSYELENPAHYGRILRDEKGDFKAIREARDCSEEEKAVKEVNAGMYCFNNEDLFEGLNQLKNDNAQNEYYLTDLAEILGSANKKVKAVIADAEELQGINDPVELWHASSWIQKRINNDWMKKGVQIMDPERTMIGKDVQIGHDVIIYPGCELSGKTVIGDNVVIGNHCTLRNTVVEDNCSMEQCVLENTLIKENSQIEPMTVKKGN